MNPPKCKDEDYLNFLIATPRQKVDWAIIDNWTGKLKTSSHFPVQEWEGEKKKET